MHLHFQCARLAFDSVNMLNILVSVSYGSQWGKTEVQQLPLACNGHYMIWSHGAGTLYALTQFTQWDKGTRTSPARLSFVLKVPLCNLRPA